MSKITRALLAFLYGALCANGLFAIDYVFPAGANVIDVTKPPYSADNTGQTDVSAILSKAANDIIAVAGWAPSIMYLPNGTYLVKNTIVWKITSHGNGVGPHMVGQSRSGTVIKLAKGTWPLGTEQKGVIQTGAGDENNFGKGVRNLTVLVDSNNAGAIGIIYVSDNNGIMSDVDVISADGKGMYGILSAWYDRSPVGGNGPFIIRRTYIKGFNVGFRACGSEGEMVSQIRLEGQSLYGIWVSCDDLVIDGLTANDTCVALQAEAPTLLTHAVLSGGSSSKYAIRNFNTSSYFHDVKTSGYKAAIQSSGSNPAPTGSSFEEYTPVAPVALFSTQRHTMNLPTKYPPDIAWETDSAKWAFPLTYKTSGRTDVQALQAAIDDSTKTTLCLPRGNHYQIDGPVYLRGTIQRVVGAGGMFHKVNSNAQLIIDDGTAPIVMLQNMSIDNVDGSPTPDVAIIKKTNRTAVFESYNMLDMTITGGGETYITDMTSGKNHIDNPDARVYIWQWEGTCCMDSTMVIRNGIVRAVGYYDEGSGSMLFCLGGLTEILGYWEYSTSCNGGGGKYLITVKDNAQVSAAGIWQQNFCNPWSGYNTLISETRNGTTKKLSKAGGSGTLTSNAGNNISLFTGYDSAIVQQTLMSGIRAVGSARANTHLSLAAVQKCAGIEIIYRTEQPGAVMLMAYDIAGRIVSVARGHPNRAGVYRTMIPRVIGILCIHARSTNAAAQCLSAAHLK